MERLLRLFHREWSGLHEAAFLLGGFAIASQVLGLVRDRLLAYTFGAGSSLDVYYAAFRIPDLLYATIASFVAVTALIPFLYEKLDQDETRVEAKKLIDQVTSLFVLIMVTACAVAFVTMPYLVRFIAPGLSGPSLDELILLSRILLLSPLILGVSNLFGSITQSFRRFTVFALGPVLYNLGIICGITVLLPIFGLKGLVFGVLCGALLHLAIQIPYVVREGFFPRFTSVINFHEMTRVIRSSFPRTLALSMTHIVTIVFIAIASRISEGSIAVFTFAMNLQSIPLAIIGTSYSVAAFPTLAKLWTSDDKEAFAVQVVTAVRHIMFWSFPAIALFIVLRAQIVRTILGSGLFDWTATRLTAAALALFAISVVAQSLQLLFLRASYAMGDMRGPMKNMLISSSITIVSAILLLSFFNSSLEFRYFIETILRVEDITGTAVLMLPLAFSIGSLLSLAMFIVTFARRLPSGLRQARTTLLHTFATSVVIGTVSYHGLQLFENVFDLETVLGIFLQGFCAGMSGVIVGVFLLRILQNAEVKEILRSLHHKFWTARPIASELDSL